MCRIVCCLLVALAFAHWTAQGSATSVAAPIFAFATSEQYFSTGDRLSLASYQVHEDFEEMVYDLVRGALQLTPSATAGLNTVVLQQHTPDTVLIVLGNQLKTSDLRSKAMHKSLQPLHFLLKQAKSSYSAPYMLRQAGMSPEYLELQQLTSPLAQTAVVGCGENSHGSLEAAVQQPRAVPAVLVYCTHVADIMAGSSEGVAEELKQLQEAHLAVAARGDRQITIYASRPGVAVSMQQRRLMQAANADAGVCGQLCQTQVKWLEGILAAFILAIAAFSGMCCLYLLDTPTRFEKPKEGARAD